MEVHILPTSPNSSKQNDQYHANVCSTSYRKRPSINNLDTDRYDTVRKMVHLNEEDDRSNAISTACRKINSEQTPVEEVKQQVQVKYTNRQPVLGPSIRERYGYLIQPYHSADYNLQQKMLFRMQASLDEHLQYLKLHRGRRRGEFFKSNHIIMELYHLKQILFIDKDLYVCKREKDKDNNWDILVDLPENIKIEERKKSFKEKLYNYLVKSKAFEGPSRNNIHIPLYKFPFEEKIEENNQVVVQKQQRQAEIMIQLQQAKQTRQKLNLKTFFSKEQKFKENLHEMIMAKEKKLKEMAMMTPAAVKQFGKEQVMKVLDQIHLAYTGKKIFNMFRANLVGIVTKQLNLHDHVVMEILQTICKNAGEYLKQVNHSKGLILQMNAKEYSLARSKLMEISH